MSNSLYQHKPEKITSIEDLIRFFEPIPEKQWCRGRFRNFNGQLCAAGHLGAAYRDNPYKGWDVIEEAFGEDLYDLAVWNNMKGSGPKDGTLLFLATKLSTKYSQP